MRLIRSGALAPELNLALDEALLRSGTETLRLYAWDPPGLSLGFFQRAAEFECPPGFRLVRRPTGGGAIAHTGELTVALVGRRRRVDAVYREVNAWVTAALAKLGISVGPGEGEPEAAPAGLCFDAHTRYDLLARGRKVFGSAQRRGGDRFLLHGSLVLEPNPLARGAVAVSDLAGRPVERAEMEQAIVAAVQEMTGGDPLRAAAPTPSEWADAQRLVSRRYARDAWTLRR